MHGVMVLLPGWQHETSLTSEPDVDRGVWLVLLPGLLHEVEATVRHGTTQALSRQERRREVGGLESRRRQAQTKLC